MIPLGILGAASVRASDPYWSNVVSLLHFDGAGGSTIMTDRTGRAWAPSGNAQLDTSQKKFGSASLLLDGSGDFLSTPDSDDFDFGSGDFTIDSHFRTPSLPGPAGWRAIITQRAGSNSDHAFTLFLNESGGQPRFAFTSDGTTVLRLDSDTAIATNTWQHLAVARSGNMIRLFLQGQVVDELNIGASAIHNSSQPVKIGANDHPVSGSFMLGHLDEIRVTKGVARYTGNFSPPAAPFPNS